MFKFLKEVVAGSGSGLKDFPYTITLIASPAIRTSAGTLVLISSCAALREEVVLCLNCA